MIYSGPLEPGSGAAGLQKKAAFPTCYARSHNDIDAKSHWPHTFVWVNRVLGINYVVPTRASRKHTYTLVPISDGIRIFNYPDLSDLLFYTTNNYF